jgi:hypothetical protein
VVFCELRVQAQQVEAAAQPLAQALVPQAARQELIALPGALASVVAVQRAAAQVAL